MKVFLDACCLSRLTDDQSQPRIRREAEAIERILGLVHDGVIELVSSEALHDEIQRNPSDDRRIDVAALIALASQSVELDDGVVRRAKQLESKGYGSYDALHLAAAESAMVDILLTTDDKFVQRATRGTGRPLVPVRNPLSWFQEKGL